MGDGFYVMGIIKYDHMSKENQSKPKGYISLPLLSKPIYFMGLSPVMFAALMLIFVLLLLVLAFIKMFILIPLPIVGIVFVLGKLNKIVKQGHPDIAYSYLTVKPATKQRYKDESNITLYLINKK